MGSNAAPFHMYDPITQQRRSALASGSCLYSTPDLPTPRQYAHLEEVVVSEYSGLRLNI